MAIGNYLSNMFLGTAFNQGEQPEGAKRGMDELWKIYQQAYNVKPIWNGKQWVMPPGAVQRFQMLLPLIQSQIQGAYQGQGKQGSEGNYGLLGSMLPTMGKGLMEAGVKKMDGWGGILDKIGGGIKGLWGGGSMPDTNATDFYNPQSDWLSEPQNIEPVSNFNVDDIYSQADPYFSDMADYADPADFVPADVTEYTDWSWF